MVVTFSCGFASGPSLASVMSMARPIRGLRRAAATRAPRRPTSSCTRRDRDDLAVVVAERPEGLDHHVEAGAVVQALAGHQVAQARHAALARDHVAGPHQLAHAVAGQPHVHEVVLELGRLALLLVGHQVDGLRPQHAEQVLAPVHHHPLGGQRLRVEAAQRQQPQVAGVVDVADHEADLVHVGREHQARAAPPGPARDQAAERVDRDLVGRRLQLAARDLADALLAPGRPGRLAQLRQQLEVHPREATDPADGGPLAGPPSGHRAPGRGPMRTGAPASAGADAGKVERRHAPRRS